MNPTCLIGQYCTLINAFAGFLMHAGAADSSIKCVDFLNDSGNVEANIKLSV